MRNTRHRLTEGEWAILQVVWALEPCAAPTVQEALEKLKKWSYSTVKTMMDRMVEKGLLKTEKIRNLILYRALINRKQAQRGEIMRTVMRAFDGALTPMMQFLLENEKFSEEELNKLRQIVEKARSQKE